MRTFVSSAVDEATESVAAYMRDPTLACMLRNTLPNCLDTTVFLFTPAGDPRRVNGSCAQNAGFCSSSGDEDDTFIITGDISAMWLRDSMNQVMPYMRYATRDARLRALLRGLLRRQVRQIHTDVYANAHNVDRATGQMNGDRTTKPSYLGTTVDARSPLVFERKYELDSLCAFLKLGAEYYDATGDAGAFDAAWARAVAAVVSTMKSQQAATSDDEGIYRFQRCSSCEPTDTLAHGVGFPGARTGMVRSAFRPSDDATTYPFLVPANAMAVVELRRTARILRQVRGDDAMAQELEVLASEIDDALHREALVVHGKTKEVVFAYEVDGFGNALHMDDANVPSLLSLPYLGYTRANDTVYLATRRAILNSTTNPYYFVGSAGRGVGSPHTARGNIWPMSIIMQALTSEDDTEIVSCLGMLTSTTASRWFMHESFNQDDASSFTRPWFSWANSLFGELIHHLAKTRPHLLLNSDFQGASTLV